ncbi:MAG: BlaI/MecI/CopY family transcriptional regulator [Planctomycetota bacterium]
MARPSSGELTPRELAVMRVFWDSTSDQVEPDRSGLTAEKARESLAQGGESLAYPTVANVIRALVERGYLRQHGAKRPFRFTPARAFEDVASGLVGDLLSRLFSGSREAMLVHLLDRRKLTTDERVYLESLLKEDGPDESR